MKKKSERGISFPVKNSNFLLELHFPLNGLLFLLVAEIDTQIHIQRYVKKAVRKSESTIEPNRNDWLWFIGKCVISFYQYISIALNLTYNKNKLHKTLDFRSRDLRKVSEDSFFTTFSVWFHCLTKSYRLIAFSSWDIG